MGADLLHPKGAVSQSVSQSVGRTETERVTHMTKLTVAFRNFTNATERDKPFIRSFKCCRLFNFLQNNFER